MKAHALLIAVGVLAACQRDVPTASSPVPPTVRLTADQVRVARIALDDVVSRVVPRLTRATASPLASHLARVLSALNSGSVDAVALADAISQIDQHERTADIESAELQVVRLALETVRH